MAQESSFNAAVRRLYFTLITPGCLPPLVWGAPGSAKTSLVHQIAHTLKEPLETVIASICDPTDFGGAFVPDGDSVKRLPMSWAKRLADAGRGIAFFDELSTAPPAVQAALLRTVLDKVAGDTPLPFVRFMAAANPPEQAAGGHDLSDPLANRFIHLMWPGPDVEEWSSFIMTGESVADSLPVFDAERFDRQLPQSRALVSAFLRKRRVLFNEDPEKVRGRFPMAFATPRTWDAAARLHATATIFGDETAKALLMAGAVGEGAATEFCAYERSSDLPDVEMLLADPEKWKPDPKRPDRTFAVVLMVAAAATQPQKDPKVYGERWDAAWEVFGRTMEQGKDLVVIGARMLAKARPTGKEALLKKRVQTIIKELVGVVRDSGLVDG